MQWIGSDSKNLKNFRLIDYVIASFFSLVLTLCYGCTINWHNSNIFVSIVLIAGFYYLTKNIFQILTRYLIAVFSKPHIIPSLDFSSGIPFTQKTAIIYVVKASYLEEVELAFLNMEESFKNNSIPDPKDNLIAIYLSSSNNKSIIKREIELTRVMQSKYGKNRIFLFHRNPSIKNWGLKWGAYQDLFCYLYKGQRYPNYYTSPWIIGGKDYARKNNQSFFLFTKDFAEEADMTEFEASNGIVGDVETLAAGIRGQRVENAIICDSDNEWPVNSIRKTIEKMAHPHNQKYGMFQSLIEISNARESLYSAIKKRSQIIYKYNILFTWLAFKRITFYGKGGIRIGRYISNIIKPQILSPDTKSHDFQEALYLSCALMPNIFILERTPNSYLSELKRHFRWIVGDIHGLIQQTKFWKLLDGCFRLNFRGFWEILKGKNKIKGKRFLLEHVERAIMIDIVFAGWVFLGIISLCSPHLLSISEGKQSILNLILIVVISGVILPRMFLPTIISFRQNKDKKYKTVFFSPSIGLIDALISTVIFLQNLIYNPAIVLRALYIITKRKSFKWQSMAIIEKENSGIGLIEYIFRLKYSFAAGLLLFYITYNTFYPKTILHNMLAVLIFSLVAGPFFSWFTAQKRG